MQEGHVRVCGRRLAGVEPSVDGAQRKSTPSQLIKTRNAAAAKCQERILSSWYANVSAGRVYERSSKLKCLKKVVSINLKTQNI